MAKEQDIITEALHRFETAADSWQDTYDLALGDVAFVDEPESQWDETSKNNRKNRPCLTFDKLSASVDRVVGSQFANMPSIKVRASEEGDEDTAEVFQGLIRQIDQRGLKAFKTAYKFAVKGGWGCVLIDHDFIDDVSLNQDIIIREIKNPFSVLIDPVVQAQPVEEARYGFVFEDIERDEFERMYPKAKSEGSQSDFESTGNFDSWVSDDYVRVADYYRIVTTETRLVQLSDGRVVDYSQIEPIADELNLNGITLGKERRVQMRKLERYKLTALEVLEEIECVGRFIPIVPVFGKTTNVDGTFFSRGIVQKAKDAQKMYNYARSVAVEVTALTPKQPYLVTPGMIKGHEERWRNMMTSSDPVMFFNFDQGQKPFREAPAQGSPALSQDAQLASQDIQATTGIFEANLGQQGNETSGVAIRGRQFQGELTNYEYADQLSDAMELAGKICIDLIPKIYDTERQIRILGEDETEEVIAVNKPLQDMQTGEFILTNDLSVGHYDIKMATGPSFSTRKQETAEQLSQIIAQNPDMSQLVGDILFKNMDLVGGDEVISRLRSAGVKAGIIEPDEQEAVALQQQMQQQQQIEAQAAQLEIAMKQAEIMNEQADTRESESKAFLNNVKAQLEQLELAQAQQDLEAQKIAAFAFKTKHWTACCLNATQD
jgi:hypothetical protein